MEVWTVNKTRKLMEAVDKLCKLQDHNRKDYAKKHKVWEKQLTAITNRICGILQMPKLDTKNRL